MQYLHHNENVVCPTSQRAAEPAQQFRAQMAAPYSQGFLLYTLSPNALTC